MIALVMPSAVEDLVMRPRVATERNSIDFYTSILVMARCKRSTVHNNTDTEIIVFEEL